MFAAFVLPVVLLLLLLVIFVELLLTHYILGIESLFFPRRKDQGPGAREEPQRDETCPQFGRARGFVRFSFKVRADL